SKEPSAAPLNVDSRNPGSSYKKADFVNQINNSQRIVPYFKNKIKLNKKANAIEVPDLSADKVVPGKEWLFDLGKAGNDWEITTAALVVDLDGPTFFKLQENLQQGEERGFATSSDPDDSLLHPSKDLTN